MSTYSKFVKNTAIFALSNFASKILIFLLVPLYTRTMTTSDLGTSDLVVSLVSFAFPIFSLCVSEGVLRYGMGKKWNREKIFTFGLYIILIGFIILCLFFPIVNKLVGEYTVYFYLIYCFSCMSQYFNQFARAIDEIELIGVVGVIGSIIVVSGNIVLLLLLHLGAKGYLTSYLLMYIITTVILFFKGRMYKYIYIGKINTEIKKELMLYNAPLIPSKVNWWMISISNRYILNYFCGASKVGVYSAANKLPLIITTVYSIVQQSLLLSVIELHEKESEQDIYKLVSRLMNIILAIVVMCVSLGVTLCSDLLFGKNFHEAWRITPLLVLAAFFGALHGNLTTLYIANKNTKVLFSNSLIGAVSSLVFNFFCIKFMGLQGSAFAMFLTYFIVWLHLYKMNTSTEEKINNKWSITVILVFQSLMALWVNEGFFCIVSVILLIIVISINIEEVKWFLNKLIDVITKRKNET